MSTVSPIFCLNRTPSVFVSSDTFFVIFPGELDFFCGEEVNEDVLLTEGCPELADDGDPPDELRGLSCGRTVSPFPTDCARDKLLLLLLPDKEAIPITGSAATSIPASTGHVSMSGLEVTFFSDAPLVLGLPRACLGPAWSLGAPKLAAGTVGG